MKSIVTDFIRKHQLLTKNTTVLVGVSGGPDSMALLHFYLSIRDEWNLNVVAISVDHQLRGVESRRDLFYVRETCERWKVEMSEASLDVQTYKEAKKIGTQVAARKLRYQFFKQQMKRHHADYLALGHHGDDQTETMLMGLVRSSSTVALSGIPVKRAFVSGHIVRPFLCITKTAINNYCQANDINPRIDPSNHATDYTRNYFRKYLIPIIKEKNSNIHTTVQRLSESLQADELYLQEEAKKAFYQIVNLDKRGKKASFEINVFISYPPALQRRTYHLILNYLYNELPGSLSYAHEDIFFWLLEENQGNIQMDFPSNLKLERSYQHVTFYFQDKNMDDPTFQEVLRIPGKVSLPDGSKVIANYTDSLSEKDDNTYICTSTQVNLPLHIRTRRDGDRMSWKGLNGHKKIKDIFIDAKIPRKERETWPLVTDNNGEVLWLIGLRKGKPMKSAKNGEFSRPLIEISYVRAGKLED